MSIYEQGEVVDIYCDLFPGNITPVPEGVPNPASTKLRIVVTQRALTVLWLGPAGNVERKDIEMTDVQTSEVSFRGGNVGEYEVKLKGGCGCGAKALANVAPWPGTTLNSNARLGLAQQQAYGVPPRRFSRSR